MAFLKFPEKFLWGAATSAHQVEGYNKNDWSEWEKSPRRLNFLKKEGSDPVDFVSGKACESYNRFEEDFDIAKKLNHNIHRISIEWSRIEPEEGKWDGGEMQHYINVVKAIRERGMEPMVTLWHFTNPNWLARQGGLASKRFPELYKRFISYVVDNLKGDVKLWITFNEATTVYASMSFWRGNWPPQKKSFIQFMRVRRNVLLAHKLAYKEIKRICQSPASGDENNPIGAPVMIGAVENNTYFTAGPIPRLLGFVKLADRFVNHWFWRRARAHLDFMGLNYYRVHRLFNGGYDIIPAGDINKELENWEIYPEGIYHLLLGLKIYNKPVYITENGLADAHDIRRAKFIKDHLYNIWRAIDAGVDVRGYLHWSLLDNFEWSHGYAPRFGLVQVNYANMSRKIRPSAYEYAKIISANGLDEEELQVKSDN